MKNIYTNAKKYTILYYIRQVVLKDAFWILIEDQV